MPTSPVCGVRSSLPGGPAPVRGCWSRTAAATAWCSTERRIDACRFEDLVERGRASLAGGRAAGAVESLSEALGLWHGTPYGEHLDVERCAVECRRLEALHGLALEELVAARLELGGAGDLVPEIEALVSQYPLRERLWCFLLLALYRAGRQGDGARGLSTRTVHVDRGAGRRARTGVAAPRGGDPRTRPVTGRCFTARGDAARPAGPARSRRRGSGRSRSRARGVATGLGEGV